MQVRPESDPSNVFIRQWVMAVHCPPSCEFFMRKVKERKEKAPRDGALTHTHSLYECTPNSWSAGTPSSHMGLSCVVVFFPHQQFGGAWSSRHVQYICSYILCNYTSIIVETLLCPKHIKTSLVEHHICQRIFCPWCANWIDFNCCINRSDLHITSSFNWNGKASTFSHMLRWGR